MNTTKARPVISMTPCQSSQIASYGHCADSNTLALQFFRKGENGREPGTVYHYENVTADDFAKFERAESKGVHFGTFIKGACHDDGSPKYPCTKIEAE